MKEVLLLWDEKAETAEAEAVLTDTGRQDLKEQTEV